MYGRAVVLADVPVRTDLVRAVDDPELATKLQDCSHARREDHRA